MYKKVLDFVKYNNAFTIILGVCFLSFGISFAASPAVRDSVYSSTETVVSVDNSQIVTTDLNNFNFNLKINSITEDDRNYYVEYSYQTMVIEDGVWQIKQIDKTLKVNKEALDGKDLGLYTAKQLGENIQSELVYLKKVQKNEQDKGLSEKIVTVAYSGLIGRLLNPREETIEGYNPVIAEATSDISSNQNNEPTQQINQNIKPEVATTDESGGEVPSDNSENSSDTTPSNETVTEPVTESTSTSEIATTSETIATSEATSTQDQATSTPEIAPEATSTPETPTTTPEASSTQETATE